MCGILGALGKFSTSDFERGLLQIAHRGPDGCEILEREDDGLLLGHRRLAILELSDLGKQPMTDGELTIIFNGEIFNYKEVRKALEARGHLFTAPNSDTEVILKAFREFGPACVHHFNGMWAFAIWNSVDRTLFLSRDRFGVKPLFYAFTSKGIVFGSEMKALAPLLDRISVSRDFEWCLQNMYGYESTDKALIEGVRRFPAGHYATVRRTDTQLQPTCYWRTIDNIQDVPHSYEAQVDKFRELFFESCAIRMRADVRIGTALSGGLDSSSVAAAVNQLGNTSDDKNIAPEWQNAFVATFTGTALDETEYAREVVQSLKLKGHFYEIDPLKSFDDLTKDLWFFEELYTTSPGPMMQIYSAIRSEGISVSLDGHGADELLAGYGSMIFNAIKDEPFDRKNIKNIAATYRGLRDSDKSDFQLMVDGFSGRKNLVNFYLKKILGADSGRDEYTTKLGYFNAALYREFHEFILPTLLRNYDRYAMASGVEVRMPFLDYRLVTYCFSIPWKSKINGGYTKSILRDAMSPYLSHKVVRRKKKVGFGTPFSDWLQNSWKQNVVDMINSSSFRNSGLIDVQATTKAVENFYRKSSPSFEDGQNIWEKLMPYLWEISFYERLKKL